MNGESVRSEAAEILSALIGSVTIFLAGEHGREAEVIAKVSDLMAFAANDDAAREGGVVELCCVGCGGWI